MFKNVEAKVYSESGSCYFSTTTDGLQTKKQTSTKHLLNMTIPYKSILYIIRISSYILRGLTVTGIFLYADGSKNAQQEGKGIKSLLTW